jgi:hypothetical protein
MTDILKVVFVVYGASSVNSSKIARQPSHKSKKNMVTFTFSALCRSYLEGSRMPAEMHHAAKGSYHERWD